MTEEYDEISNESVDAPVPDKKELEKIASMGPLDQIRYAAEKFGVVLNDPNSSCKKCKGKGYVGRRWNHIKKEHQEPVACKCIQPKMSGADKEEYERRPFVPKNRKERRMAQKLAKKQYSKKQRTTMAQLAKQEELTKIAMGQNEVLAELEENEIA